MRTGLLSVISDPRYPFRFICEKWDCYWSCSFATQEEFDHWSINHPCGKNARNYVLDAVDEKGQPYTSPNLGKSIAEKLWDELDSSLAQLKSTSPPPVNMENMKGRCSGLAFAIQVMCHPYYPTVNDVTRQAVKRYRIAQGEIEWEPTPGYIYNPPPAGSRIYEEAIKNNIKPLAKESALDKLSDRQKQAIIQGVSMGFPTDQLAKSYGISEADVVKLTT